MNSGSREFDFNTMADMGKQVSENKKALDDVRSFVGPTQEEDAPEPTPVVLDGPATEEGDDNKVNLNELAYAAKRHLEEVGHPAADMLMTPANIKKLAEFENKRQRVERERLAYEEDPEGYDLNSANALDAYVKSWNLKNLTPEQSHPGPSTWKPGAADEAPAEAIAKEVPRMAPDRGNGMSVDGGSSSGGEAPAPRRQSSGGAERPAPASKVSAGKSAASAPAKGPSKTNNGVTTGPVNPRPKAEISGNFNRIVVPEKETGMASYEDPRMVAWSRGPGAAPTPEAPPSKVAQLPPDKRGKYSPDMSPSKAAALEAMGQMIPESIIPTAMAGAALKGGLPRKIAEKVETEMIPGVVNAGRKMVGKLRPPVAETPQVNNNISRVAKPPGLRDGFTPTRPAKPTSSPRIPAETPQVNNNISRVAKPVGLVKASTPPKPTRADVNKTIKAAEPTPSPRPKAPAKSATKAATNASEYLEKRDASAASKAKAKTNIKQKKNQGKGQNL